MGNDDFYKNFDNTAKKRSRTGSNILVSFSCGFIGASVALYLAFSTPLIKNKLLGPSPIQQSPVSGQGDSAQISLNDYSGTAIYVANKALPSIVGISVNYTSTSNFFSLDSRSSVAEGSGIIISADGYILTNNHIINTVSSSAFYSVSEANSINVFLYGDETPYPAKVIGTDKQTDLAVIKIEKNDLTPAILGDSSTVKIGEFVMAIGNPLGMQSSVTSGIVSATNRTVTSNDGTDYKLIQTDAAINSGNSGGALVNSQGQVVGLNTLKLSGTGVEGMGFAIPINDTIEVYNQLIDHGKVLRPYIGIAGVDLSNTMAEYYKLPVGVYIQSVYSGSSAELAGLKQADVITSIDGTQVKKMDEINDIKASKKIGDKITLTVFRNNEYTDIDLILQEAP